LTGWLRFDPWDVDQKDTTDARELDRLRWQFLKVKVICKMMTNDCIPPQHGSPLRRSAATAHSARLVFGR